LWLCNLLRDKGDSSLAIGVGRKCDHKKKKSKWGLLRENCLNFLHFCTFWIVLNYLFKDVSVENCFER
jgi:hypothetical protein